MRDERHDEIEITRHPRLTVIAQCKGACQHERQPRSIKTFTDNSQEIQFLSHAGKFIAPTGYTENNQRRR